VRFVASVSALRTRTCHRHDQISMRRLPSGESSASWPVCPTARPPLPSTNRDDPRGTVAPRVHGRRPRGGSSADVPSKCRHQGSAMETSMPMSVAPVEPLQPAACVLSLFRWAFRRFRRDSEPLGSRSVASPAASGGSSIRCQPARDGAISSATGSRLARAPALVGFVQRDRSAARGNRCPRGSAENRRQMENRRGGAGPHEPSRGHGVAFPR
jgi:hypothetical protein